jgi:hypothetical protein
MYIRCKDATGNVNENDYFIKFAIDPSPDLTPPSIRFTSLQNEGYVSADTTEVAFSAYIDEYADCKWSRRDTEYELMENSFECRNEAFGQSSLYFGTFECKTTLTNLTKSTNIFYIRCMDKPGMEASERNVMSESFKFTLKGSIPLNITNSGPSGAQYTNDIKMYVETAKGAESGKADCAFSANDVQYAEMILFDKTGTTKHEQEFVDMPAGSYTFYVTCSDAAGNLAKDTISFDVSSDTEAPELNVVYVDTMFGEVHLEFSEECTCEHSTVQSFSMGEGTPSGINTTIHSMQPLQPIYYVKCTDMFDNKGEYIIQTEITA